MGGILRRTQSRQRYSKATAKAILLMVIIWWRCLTKQTTRHHLHYLAVGATGATFSLLLDKPFGFMAANSRSNSHGYDHQKRHCINGPN